MALIKCSECTQMHSDTLVSCPACGHQRERDATPMYLDDEYLQGIVLCGKYSLEELVGKGGMAHVYRARHVHFDQFVAVKLLFRHLAKEDAMQQRFLREAKIQFGLQHPNIVRVFDFVEERGLLGVVMDWVEGYTLATWSQHQDYPLPTKQVLSIMQPLCEAIFYAHCKKVIHRDLKPGNILLTEGVRGEWVPKIVDFGIAKVMDERSEGVTTTGHTLGTPTYMSPEQIRSEKDIDHRADLYALATLFYVMLTGHAPFRRSSPLRTVMAQLEEPVPRLEDLCAGAESCFQGVLEKGLAKDPDKRFQTALEFWDAIQRTYARRSKLEFVSVLKTSGVSDHGVEGGEGLGITVSLGSSVAASRQAGRKETQSFDSGMLSLGEGLRLSADMATEITPLPVWRRQELKKAQASQALLAIVEEERGLGSDEVAFSSLSSSWAKLWGWLLLSAGLLMMSWVLWGRHSVGVETQRDASTPKPVVRTIPEKKREDVVRLVLQTKPVFATVYVDGALSGQAPWTLASKRGRQHRIVLKHRGYVTKTHVWTAGRSYTKTFVLEREMRLTLRSRPGEANVFVAGRWVGKTPHTLSMPVGKRVEVAVKKKKFLEQKFWWNFKKDTTKTVYLAPDFLNVP